MELKFYYCEDCGNLVILLKNSGVPVVCCGQKMIELTPRLQGASLEKHVPVYRVEGNQVLVTVGEAEHPMQKEHFIEWIALQTKLGSQCVALRPEEEPKAVFALREGDEVEAVYAYCNLHGLWKA